MLYNVVSAVQQRDSAIIINMYAPFLLSLPPHFHPPLLGHHRVPGWASCFIQQLLMSVNVVEPLVYEFLCPSASCPFCQWGASAKDGWREGGRKKSKARDLFTVSYPVEWFVCVFVCVCIYVCIYVFKHICMYLFMYFPIWDFFKWSIVNLKYCVSVRCTAEKAMAPHSSTLAWKIPWMEEPGRLQSMGLLRVGHDWTTSLSLFTFMH